MENPVPDAGGKTEAIAHSDRLALVDRGRVVGLFDSNEPDALKSIVEQAKRRALAGWIRALPTLNASLNALCALFLIVGWGLIRSRGAVPRSLTTLDHATAAPSSSLLQVPRVRGHVACMVFAVTTSAIFLVCYLVYHFYAGSMPFRGQGPTRWLYLTVLLSHTLLATFGVVPLVVLTLVRALRHDFARHRLIAATTFPIWVYVSVTGVLIYLMLYHLPIAGSSWRCQFDAEKTETGAASSRSREARARANPAAASILIRAHDLSTRPRRQRLVDSLRGLHGEQASGGIVGDVRWLAVAGL